jgi:hypothetical protein
VSAGLSLPGPGETEALLAGLAGLGEPDLRTRHAAIRALILAPAPAESLRADAILQFWDQPEPPADVLASMESWRRAGPPIQRFSDAQATDWVRTRGDDGLLDAYLHCHHPAMRSDLFRLAWLLQNGGLYVDADDAFIGDALLPGFEGGMVLLPLAQYGDAIVPVQDGLHASAAGEYCGYFVNNAPLFARAGHPVLKAALYTAVTHLRDCKARGVRGDIHEHTGPSNLNRAVVEYLAACLKDGRTPDLAVRLEWPWLRAFQPMDYKQGARNWRSGASFY